MHNYLTPDIFVKDIDAFFNDFIKDFGFLYLPKGRLPYLLYRLFGKEMKVRQFNKDDFIIIKKLILKHYGNNITFSDQQNLNAFSELIYKIFSYISNYYYHNPHARKRSYIHLAVFFLIAANYFQYIYLIEWSRNRPKSIIYLPNGGKHYRSSYRNIEEMFAEDAQERILHWFRQLPEDRETKELSRILVPILPPQLESILTPEGTTL